MKNITKRLVSMGCFVVVAGLVMGWSYSRLAVSSSIQNAFPVAYVATGRAWVDGVVTTDSTFYSDGAGQMAEIRVDTSKGATTLWWKLKDGSQWQLNPSASYLECFGQGLVAIPTAEFHRASLKQKEQSFFGVPAFYRIDVGSNGTVESWFAPTLGRHTERITPRTRDALLNVDYKQPDPSVFRPPSGMEIRYADKQMAAFLRNGNQAHRIEERMAGFQAIKAKYGLTFP